VSATQNMLKHYGHARKSSSLQTRQFLLSHKTHSRQMALLNGLYTIELFAKWSSTTECQWSVPATTCSASNTDCVSTQTNRTIKQKRKHRIRMKA